MAAEKPVIYLTKWQVEFFERNGCIERRDGKMYAGLTEVLPVRLISGELV